MSEKIKLLSDNNVGVKENGILAFNDEGGIFKAIELASSRASTATYVNQSGLIATAESGVPRIDWTNGVGELLLEPQSTNEITYSEDFTDASWSKSNINLTSNTLLSPDGSVNASLIKGDGIGNFPRLQTNVSASGDCTYSVFVKKEISEELTLYVVGTGLGGGADTTSAYRYVFNTDSFIKITGADANTLTSVDYGNGWIKLSMSIASTTITQIRLYTDWSNVSTDGVYVWGFQLEELNYPTSYIRTSGSSVTRIADAVTGNSSLGQVINSSEGVLYAEISKPFFQNPDTFILLSLNNASANNDANSVTLGFDTADHFYARIKANSSDVLINSNTSATQDDFHKVAVKYSESGDNAIWINGVEIASNSTSFSFALTLDNLSFDFNGNGALPFYGRIRELKVYDTALTDAELQTLTTL